jgi:hypothetical protein
MYDSFHSPPLPLLKLKRRTKKEHGKIASKAICHAPNSLTCCIVLQQESSRLALADWLRLLSGGWCYVSERCGIIVRKLNPHRVFFSVPSISYSVFKVSRYCGFDYFSIVRSSNTLHDGHLTCKWLLCLSGGGLPRFDNAILLFCGILPSFPLLHFGHNIGLPGL